MADVEADSIEPAPCEYSPLSKWTRARYKHFPYTGRRAYMGHALPGISLVFIPGVAPFDRERSCPV